MVNIGQELDKIPAGDQNWDKRDGDIQVISKASAILPQTTQSALFNVIGGRIEILNILGEVSVIIETQANDTKIVANPTSGSDTDLCAVLDITAKAVGTRFSITGTFANAMIETAVGIAVAKQATVVVVEVGTIDLSCAASNTGETNWVMHYRSIDTGAYVTSA